MNIVVLRGVLSRDAECRDLPSGDRLVALEVTVRPPEGPAESVPVAWFEAPARAAKLRKGAEVVVSGRVRRRFFKIPSGTASRTEVVAEAVVPVTQRARVDHLVEGAAAALAAPLAS
jgi:single-strand DNA-binding protein